MIEPTKIVQLQIRMSDALHEKLRRRAFKDRRSLASMARQLIEDGLKPGRKPEPIAQAIEEKTRARIRAKGPGRGDPRPTILSGEAGQ